MFAQQFIAAPHKDRQQQVFDCGKLNQGQAGDVRNQRVIVDNWLAGLNVMRPQRQKRPFSRCRPTKRLHRKRLRIKGKLKRHWTAKTVANIRACLASSLPSCGRDLKLRRSETMTTYILSAKRERFLPVLRQVVFS